MYIGSQRYRTKSDGIISVVTGIILLAFSITIFSPIELVSIPVAIFGVILIIVGIYVVKTRPKKEQPQNQMEIDRQVNRRTSKIRTIMALILICIIISVIILTYIDSTIDCSKPQSYYWWTVNDYNLKCSGTTTSRIASNPINGS